MVPGYPVPPPQDLPFPMTWIKMTNQRTTNARICITLFSPPVGLFMLSRLENTQLDCPD